MKVVIKILPNQIFKESCPLWHHFLQSNKYFHSSALRHAVRVTFVPENRKIVRGARPGGQRKNRVAAAGVLGKSTRLQPYMLPPTHWSFSIFRFPVYVIRRYGRRRRDAGAGRPRAAATASDNNDQPFRLQTTGCWKSDESRRREREE